MKPRQTAAVNLEPRRLPAVPTNVGLLAALAGPSLFVAVSDRLFGESPRLAVQIVLQILYCGLVPLVVWIVVRHERLPLRSIGLRRPDLSTLVTVVLLWAVSYALQIVTEPVLDLVGRSGVDEGIQRLVALPVWFRVVVGATGGIVEETLYRGYAVERLGAITARPWLGGAISAIVFALAHVPYWGFAFALVADLPFGIVMTAFYLWRRDLLANIIVHSGGLVVAMMTLPS